jgi:hypothetical protein
MAEPVNDNETNLDLLVEWIATLNEEAIFFDGYEDAIIGVAERCSMSPLVVYDAKKCVEILMQRDGMSEEDAHEFFEFNTLGCWAGDNTPLFLWRPEMDTDNET